MTELNYDQRNALLARGYNIIDVKVNGKWKFIMPTHLEDKVFELYNDFVESDDYSKEHDRVERMLFNTCNKIVDNWTDSKWEKWDDAKYPREDDEEHE